MKHIISVLVDNKPGVLARVAGLFSARLGYGEKALSYGQYAFAKDSSEESVIDLAKIYCILGKKGETLEWFSRARKMNSEYDPAYLAITLDFEKFKNDDDLLSVARK